MQSVVITIKTVILRLSGMLTQHLLGHNASASSSRDQGFYFMLEFFLLEYSFNVCTKQVKLKVAVK